LKTVKELLDFAVEAKFPEHHLVLRPEHQDHPQIYKNISDEQRLVNVFLLAQIKTFTCVSPVSVAVYLKDT
jgi:hypothetical protein